MKHLLMSETTGATDIERKYFSLIGGIPRRLAFIPSQTDSARKYFQRTGDHFRSIGVQEIIYCDLDLEFEESVFEKIFSCDIVYLSGGFTPYFLKTLIDRNAIVRLQEFAGNGGAFIGVSAGALVMGQDISILFDDPEEGLEAKSMGDVRGLGFYGFEFWPHFENDKNICKMLKARSVGNRKKILACDNNSGVIFGGDQYEIVGQAFLFEDGLVKTIKESI